LIFLLLCQKKEKAMTNHTSQSKHTIGWIGLGRMGEAMVKQLSHAGHEVQVWNRTRSKAEPLVAYGAKLVDHKKDLAKCDVVFTMVSTTDDLKEVLFAEGGLVTTKVLPKVLIDSSSISQEGSAEIRERLEALGVAYLCAPVSGNAKVAKAGKLLLVASGPKALYDMAEPYLKAVARKTMWVGEGELARVWKIAHNTMFGVVIQNLCEITVMAEKAGIPRHVFLESINDSVLGSMYTRYKTPVLSNLNFEQVTFTPKLLLKDMDLGMAAGKAYGVSMPSAAATRESVARMVGRGHDNVDFSILLQEVAHDAGLELKSENVQVSDGLESK
jgi:3-hydroxyisobutyrate dehydrogenase